MINKRVIVPHPTASYGWPHRTQ